jgi:hypothetical protein
MTTNLTPTTPTVAFEQLTQELRDYYKGTEDLKDYQARIARAEADQESALSSQTLGDEEIAEEISKLISLKAVLAARIERKQTDLARLTGEMEKLHPQAARDLNALISQELDRRQALVTERITQALEIGNDLTTYETVSLPSAIAALMPYSQAIRVISGLRAGVHWSSPGDGPAICAAATTLLSNLKQFEELTK